MLEEISDKDFDRIIAQATGPVLVEFWQPGCNPCQALMKELALVQEAYGPSLRIFGMNVQENFLIPAELEIQSLPALALYVHGTFEKFIGGIGRKQHILDSLPPS